MALDHDHRIGLPDAAIRQLIGRAPPIQGGIEIVEISRADGRSAERTVQDPGAVMLIVGVRDIEATLAADETRRAGAHDGRRARAGYRRAAWRARPRSGRSFRRAAATRHVLALLGLPSTAQYRFATLTVPTSGLLIELLEFKGASRPTEPARVADPGSTRIQLRVSNIDAAVAALTQAGGAVVSTGGRPLDLPTGNTTLRVAMVRDPDGLFVVLIQAPPAPR